MTKPSKTLIEIEGCYIDPYKIIALARSDWDSPNQTDHHIEVTIEGDRTPWTFYSFGCDTLAFLKFVNRFLDADHQILTIPTGRT